MFFRYFEVFYRYLDSFAIILDLILVYLHFYLEDLAVNLLSRALCMFFKYFEVFLIISCLASHVTFIHLMRHFANFYFCDFSISELISENFCVWWGGGA